MRPRNSFNNLRVERCEVVAMCEHGLNSHTIAECVRPRAAIRARVVNASSPASLVLNRAGGRADVQATYQRTLA